MFLKKCTVILLSGAIGIPGLKAQSPLTTATMNKVSAGFKLTEAGIPL